MEDPYVTTNQNTDRLVDLKQIYNKDLMYKGYCVFPTGTGLSSHEVNQPGSYRDVTDTGCGTI
jgi:isoleucyl-tRNA synthetase